MSSFNLFGALVSLLAKIELLPVLKKLLEITRCKSSTIIQIRGAKKKTPQTTTWLQSDPSMILSKERVCVSRGEPAILEAEGRGSEWGGCRAGTPCKESPSPAWHCHLQRWLCPVMEASTSDVRTHSNQDKFNSPSPGSELTKQTSGYNLASCVICLQGANVRP